MKILIKLLYSFYLITFLDLLFIDPILNIYSYYGIVYAFVLLFLFCYISKGKVQLEFLKINASLLIFTGLITFSVVRSLTNNTVWIKMLCMLVILVCNSYFFKKYNLFQDVVVISFLISSLFLLWRFLVEGAPLEVYSKLNLLFGSAWNMRYRVSFGTYHPNAAGNIACCAILISFVLLSITDISRFTGKIKALCILGLDLVNVTVLLATDSRSSILAVAVCILVLLFFRTTMVNNKMLRIFFRVFLAVLACVVLFVYMAGDITDLFVTSQRLRNFTENLPYLNSPLKVVLGLGLIDPSDFGNGTTGLGRTFYVDNYFLYIMLSLGLTGLAAVLYIMISYVKRFMAQINKSKNITATILMSVFLAHIFTSTGETSFLYCAFPSAAIYFSIYTAYFGFTEGGKAINGYENS